MWITIVILACLHVYTLMLLRSQRREDELRIKRVEDLDASYGKDCHLTDHRLDRIEHCIFGPGDEDDDENTGDYEVPPS